MTRVAGVRFRKASKIYYFDPGDMVLRRGDLVVVETSRGVEIGEVAVRPKRVPAEDVPGELKRILRTAEREDVDTDKAHGVQAKEAFKVALDRIEHHDLAMKLIDAEFTLDGSKVIFYFSAEKRVDFRELVKDLSKRFTARVELRQIGVRDEAKMLGGYGICGQPLCCATWVADFEPVSIRHAKEQNLALNPSKISGVCGRLKCCLRFEAETYREVKKMLPKIGQTVTTSQGAGKVVDVMIIKESVLVQLTDGGRVEVKGAELAQAAR